MWTPEVHVGFGMWLPGTFRGGREEVFLCGVLGRDGRGWTEGQSEECGSVERVTVLERLVHPGT